MATFTPVKLTNAGQKQAFAATTPAGDVVVPAGDGDTIVEFRNTHSASITISVAPTLTTTTLDGVGTITVPTRSVALAQNEEAVFRFTTQNSQAYLNASGQIPFTYTTGNVLLLQRVLAS